MNNKSDKFHRYSELIEDELKRNISVRNEAQQFSEKSIDFSKKYMYNESPNLFSDIEGDDKKIHTYKNVIDHSMNSYISIHVDERHFVNNMYTYLKCKNIVSDEIIAQYNDNCTREKNILKRIQNCLSGIPPPPSITLPQVDMFDMVLTHRNSILNFLNDILPHNKVTMNYDNNVIYNHTNTHSLLKPTKDLKETKMTPWRDILGIRQHGFSYNLTKDSETIEHLNLLVVERFIGAETASSHRNSPSSAQKRITRSKLICRSPGNRLSHLARRRAVFSSANLANTSEKTKFLIGRQITLEKKKTKCSRKNSTVKCLILSAKKKTFSSELIKPGPSRENSKRALFQSPNKHIPQKKLTTEFSLKPKKASYIDKSKRFLLFTPEKNVETSLPQCLATNTDKLNLLLKRKREFGEDSEELNTTAKKIFNSNDVNLTPRTLKIKSQSFCIGAGSSKTYSQKDNITVTNSETRNVFTEALHTNKLIKDAKIQRAYSDVPTTTNNLTENQKKKLLWAVSIALKEKKITTKSENFKELASVLAKVVRRIFQEYYQKYNTSNSETMLKLSKQYVHYVIVGLSIDEIYIKAKQKFEDSRHQSYKRLSGYIGPEEFKNYKEFLINKCNSNNHSSIGSQTSTLSIRQFHSEESRVNKTCSESRIGDFEHKLVTNSICCESSLQHSSSKNNLNGIVLRENVDNDLKRSAQKYLTGKDQCNLSIYINAEDQPSSIKIQTKTDLSILNSKVKRQIIFDS